jgi:hypothetical protein
MSIWIKSLGVVAALLGVSAAVDLAQAQTYPARALTLVIPFAPGGSTSIVGRAIADKMSELLGEKVVVESAPRRSPEAIPTATRCCWATPGRSPSVPRFTRTPATIRARILRRSA